MSSRSYYQIRERLTEEAPVVFRAVRLVTPDRPDPPPMVFAASRLMKMTMRELLEGFLNYQPGRMCKLEMSGDHEEWQAAVAELAPTYAIVE